MEQVQSRKYYRNSKVKKTTKQSRSLCGTNMESSPDFFCGFRTKQSVLFLPGLWIFLFNHKPKTLLHILQNCSGSGHYCQTCKLSQSDLELVSRPSVTEGHHLRGVLFIDHELTPHPPTTTTTATQEHHPVRHHLPPPPLCSRHHHRPSNPETLY